MDVIYANNKPVPIAHISKWNFRSRFEPTYYLSVYKFDGDFRVVIKPRCFFNDVQTNELYLVTKLSDLNRQL